MGFTLSREHYEAVSNADPGAVERVLKLVRSRMARFQEAAAGGRSSRQAGCTAGSSQPTSPAFAAPRGAAAGTAAAAVPMSYAQPVVAATDSITALRLGGPLDMPSKLLASGAPGGGIAGSPAFPTLDQALASSLAEKEQQLEELRDVNEVGAWCAVGVWRAVGALWAAARAGTPGASRAARSCRQLCSFGRGTSWQLLAAGAAQAKRVTHPSARPPLQRGASAPNKPALLCATDPGNQDQQAGAAGAAQGRQDSRAAGQAAGGGAAAAAAAAEPAAAAARHGRTSVPNGTNTRAGRSVSGNGSPNAV